MDIRRKFSHVQQQLCALLIEVVKQIGLFMVRLTIRGGGGEVTPPSQTISKSLSNIKFVNNIIAIRHQNPSSSTVSNYLSTHSRRSMQLLTFAGNGDSFAV